MAHIFISYEKRDRSWVSELARALQDRGWTVWWDRKIPIGKSFYDVIEAAIDSSQCIIVVWSENSVSSDWVRNEAEEGKRRGVLVPVLHGISRIPIGFRHLQAAQLSSWSYGIEDSAFDDLVQSVHAIIPLTGISDPSTGSATFLSSDSVLQSDNPYSLRLVPNKELPNKAISDGATAPPKNNTKASRPPSNDLLPTARASTSIGSSPATKSPSKKSRSPQASATLSRAGPSAKRAATKPGPRSGTATTDKATAAKELKAKAAKAAEARAAREARLKAAKAAEARERRAAEAKAREAADKRRAARAARAAAKEAEAKAARAAEAKAARERAARRKAESSSPAAKTALSPAAAWPFPTGNKP